MKNPIAALALILAAAVPTLAQQPSPLPLPPALEKELSSRASDVTEVTLGKNMLGFASKYMTGKDGDDATTRQLIQNLDGIYVRNYEFDKDNQYSMEQLEQLRKSFETPEWNPIVRQRERSGESTEVLVKMVNGESRGLFILSAEPRELSIVLILGPIRMQDLSKLRGLGNLGPFADFDDDNDTVKSKPKAKAKDKGKSDGDDQ
jgi:hypothetical protein